MSWCRRFTRFCCSPARKGVIGLEEHILQPKTSSIFAKYPSFLNDHHAVHFLQDTFRPLLDGKVKPEELSRSVEAQLDNFFAMNSQPTAVLSKASDALPRHRDRGRGSRYRHHHGQHRRR